MKLQRWFGFLILLIGCALSSGCGRPVEAQKAGETSTPGESTEGSGSGEAVEAAEWLTDYEQALRLAKEEGKPILMNFTGSDWCPPCKLLKRDVFETDEFARYANENLILLELDYPFNKEQPPELVKQNEGLQETYKIESFPTLIVLDPEGNEEKRTIGYMEGGPSAFIGWLRG